MNTIGDPALMRLLTKIHDEKRLDFTQYKQKSILRRIHSRLHKHHTESYDEYIKIIENDPEEYKGLIGALTINVTEFFRNPESFHAIEKIVIPRVILSKRAYRHKIIRAWSCGCSSGDEPYSLAILLLESLGDAMDKFILTVIGSDIDKDTLSEARDMVYSRERLKAVDGKLLKKYFEETEEGSFRLKDFVKRLVRFKHHDVIKNRPFMHCDIILCRNILIYFNKELQEETQLKFYECLNPGGFWVW